MHCVKRGDPNGAAACLIDLSMWQATTGDARWQATFEEAASLYDFDRPTPDLVHALQESAAELTLRFFDAASAERAADQALAVAERLGLRPPPAAFEWRSEARAALGDRAMARGLRPGHRRGRGAGRRRRHVPPLPQPLPHPRVHPGAGGGRAGAACRTWTSLAGWARSTSS